MILQFFDDTHFSGYVVVVLIFFSLMCLFTTHLSSLVRCILNLLPISYWGFLGFLKYGVIYSGHSLISCFPMYLLPVFDLSFPLLNGVKVLNFDKI